MPLITRRAEGINRESGKIFICSFSNHLSAKYCSRERKIKKTH